MGAVGPCREVGWLAFWDGLRDIGRGAGRLPLVMGVKHGISLSPWVRLASLFLACALAFGTPYTAFAQEVPSEGSVAGGSSGEEVEVVLEEAQTAVDTTEYGPGDAESQGTSVGEQYEGKPVEDAPEAAPAGAVSSDQYDNVDGTAEAKPAATDPPTGSGTESLAQDGALGEDAAGQYAANGGNFGQYENETGGESEELVRPQYSNGCGDAPECPQPPEGGYQPPPPHEELPPGTVVPWCQLYTCDANGDPSGDENFSGWCDITGCYEYDGCEQFDACDPEGYEPPAPSDPDCDQYADQSTQCGSPPSEPAPGEPGCDQYADQYQGCGEDLVEPSPATPTDPSAPEEPPGGSVGEGNGGSGNEPDCSYNGDRPECSDVGFQGENISDEEGCDQLFDNDGNLEAGEYCDRDEVPASWECVPYEDGEPGDVACYDPDDDGSSSGEGQRCRGSIIYDRDGAATGTGDVCSEETASSGWGERCGANDCGALWVPEGGTCFRQADGGVDCVYLGDYDPSMEGEVCAVYYSPSGVVEGFALCEPPASGGAGGEEAADDALDTIMALGLDDPRVPGSASDTRGESVVSPARIDLRTGVARFPGAYESGGVTGLSEPQSGPSALVPALAPAGSVASRALGLRPESGSDAGQLASAAGAGQPAYPVPADAEVRAAAAGPVGLQEAPEGDAVFVDSGEGGTPTRGAETSPAGESESEEAGETLVRDQRSEDARDEVGGASVVRTGSALATEGGANGAGAALRNQEGQAADSSGWGFGWGFAAAAVLGVVGSVVVVRRTL